MTRPNLRTGIALAGPVALAAALRLHRLGFQSFWADEIASIEAAQTPGIGLIGWFSTDPHPPLFFVLLKLWLPGGTGEAWLRTFPALCGIATVAVLWLLARRVAGTAVATVAATLLAVTPLAIWTSQELRGTALLALLAVLSAYLLVLYLEEGGKGRRRGFIAAAVLMLYTHYYAVFVVLFEAAWALARSRSARDGRRRALTAFVWIGVGFLPWLPFFVSQFRHGQNWRIYKSVGKVAGQFLLYFTTSHSPWKYETFSPTLDQLYYGATAQFEEISYLLLAPFAVLAAVGLVRAMRADMGRGFATAFFLVPAVAVTLVSREVPLFEPKYAVCMLPAASLVLAVGLVHLWRNSKVFAIGAAIWMLALAATGLVHLYADPEYARPDWRKFGRLVTESVTERDAVLVYQIDTMPDFLYYYSGRAPVFPIFLSPDHEPRHVERPEQVREALARMGPRRTIWFLDGMAFLHDPEKIAARTLDEDLVLRDKQWVWKTADYSIRRYEPRGGG